MVSRTPCGYYQGTLGYPGLDLDFVVRGQSRSTSSRVRQRHCLQDPQETRRAPPPEPPSGPLEPRGPVLRSSAEETQEHQRLRPSG